MITKSRLEELISKGATIWSKTFTEEVYLNSRCFLIPITETNEIGKEEITNYMLSVYEDETHTNKYLITELEEDVKKCKWSLKYQHIPRTEELNLPMWEEFITEDKYNYYGTSYFAFDNYRLIAKLPDEDDDCEFIGIDVDGNTELYHWEEATEENYIKACDLCVKLFKGEEEC